MEVTTASHGLTAGDGITMPIRLSRWARFLLWLAKPWEWPPESWQGTYVITSVTNGNTFEIERAIWEDDGAPRSP